MSLWSWLFVGMVAILIPMASRRSARVAGAAGMSRVAVYANASVSLWVIAAVGYVILRLDGDRPGDIGATLAGMGLARLTVWVVGLTAAGLVLFVASHLLGRLFGWRGEREALARMRPTNGYEMIWLVLVLSPSAGICEEWVYRGLVMDRMGGLTTPLIGSVLASVVFGAAHLYQGWYGGLRAALIGQTLTLPVLVDGTFFPSILAHALIDILANAWVWPWLEPEHRP